MEDDTLKKVLDRKRKTQAEKTAEAIGGCLGTCVGLLIWYGACIAVLGCTLWLLWDWIVPAVFHGPKSTFWVACGMVVFLGLIASLFKNSKEK